MKWIVTIMICAFYKLFNALIERKMNLVCIIEFLYFIYGFYIGWNNELNCDIL